MWPYNATGSNFSPGGHISRWVDTSLVANKPNQKLRLCNHLTIYSRLCSYGRQPTATATGAGGGAGRPPRRGGGGAGGGGRARGGGWGWGGGGG